VPWYFGWFNPEYHEEGKVSKSRINNKWGRNTPLLFKGIIMTKLIKITTPNSDEIKNGAEVAFIRKDNFGRFHRVLGCKCYESWEQWGADREILSDNVRTIEIWRRQQHG
jgi:hypothetical protein